MIQGEFGDGVSCEYIWGKSRREVLAARIRSVRVSTLEVVEKLCRVGVKKDLSECRPLIPLFSHESPSWLESK